MSALVKRVLKEIKDQHFDSWDDLLKECGLDFEAELRHFWYETNKPLKDEETGIIRWGSKPYGDHFLTGQPYASAVVRTDTEECLGIGSTIYGVVQYRDWFALAEEFFKLGIHVNYAGAPNLGERAHMILEVPGDRISLGHDDDIVNQVVITASHDGSSKLTLMSIPYRESNDTYMNLGGALFAEKHTRHVKDRVKHAKAVVSTVRKNWEELEGNIKKLSLIQMKDEQAEKFIKSIVGDGDSTRTQNVRNAVFDLWKHSGVGRAVPACRGTLFGLVQAFVEYSDHHATVRESKYTDADTANFNSKMFGANAKRKANVWAKALNMAKKKLEL